MIYCCCCLANSSVQFGVQVEIAIDARTVESCEVEEVSVGAGVEVDAIFRLAEGVGQQQGEEDTEKVSVQIHILASPRFLLEKGLMKSCWSGLCRECCTGRTRSSSRALIWG